MAEELTSQMITTQSPLTKLAGRYLTFTLAGEKYGLKIEKVQEIISMMNITRVPKAAAFLEGVINLRGKIIPVVDLRTKFGLPKGARDQTTCTLVAEVTSGDVTISVGVIVDTVLEVINLQAHQIEAAPEYGSGLGTRSILGLGRPSGHEGVTILIDLDRELSGSIVNTAGGASSVHPEEE